MACQALSVGDRGQAPKLRSGPPQAAGLRSVSNGRTINAAVRSSTRRTVSVKSSPDVYILNPKWDRQRQCSQSVLFCPFYVVTGIVNLKPFVVLSRKFLRH